MNSELKKVKKWLDAKRLALNIDKTSFCTFSSSPEPVIIKFGREETKRESCVKFLGILSDENLSWEFHINELSKKLSRAVGFFIKSDTFVHLIFCKYFYYSLYYSFLS